MGARQSIQTNNIESRPRHRPHSTVERRNEIVVHGENGNEAIDQDDSHLIVNIANLGLERSYNVSTGSSSPHATNHRTHQQISSIASSAPSTSGASTIHRYSSGRLPQINPNGSIVSRTNSRTASQIEETISSSSTRINSMPLLNFFG